MGRKDDDDQPVQAVPDQADDGDAGTDTAAAEQDAPPRRSTLRGPQPAE